MPIDFKQLRDPQWIEQRRKEEEQRQAELQEKETHQREAVDLCLNQYDKLADRERSLVRSCQSKLNSYLSITAAQEKWLMDIAKRFKQSVSATPVAQRPEESQPVLFWPVNRRPAAQTLNGNAYEGCYEGGVFIAQGIPWDASDVECWAPRPSA